MKTPLLLLTAAATLALPQLSDAAVYSQNFSFPDGTTGTGLGDGSRINGSGDGGYFPAVRSGTLELTSANATGTNSSFIIPAIPGSASGFTIGFDLFMQDIPGGNPPADGLSVTYGNTFNMTSIFGEEGPGGAQTLTWIVDTWDNGTNDRGIRSKINGNNDFSQPGTPLPDGGTINARVTLSYMPGSGYSMQVGNTTYFTNRATTGFVPGDSYLFGFGARTGGATETVRIDNLVITTIPEPAIGTLAAMAGLIGIFRRRR